MEYFVPDTINEACSLLHKYDGKAVPVAGGIFFMAHREDLFSEVEAIVDLKKLGLSYIKVNDDGLAIGAATTLVKIMTSTVTSSGIFRVLSETVSQIRPNEIRNMGTVGGNLNLSAEVDMPIPLITLNATIFIVGVTGGRSMALDEFYVGYLRTALKPGEIVTEIKVPNFPVKTGAGFYKFGRTAVDLPIVNAAALLTLGDRDKCSDTKIVLGSVAETPIRAKVAEEMLLNNKLDEKFITKVAVDSSAEIECMTDGHATGELRQRIVKVALENVLNKAYIQAKGE